MRTLWRSSTLAQREFEIWNLPSMFKHKKNNIEIILFVYYLGSWDLQSYQRNKSQGSFDLLFPFLLCSSRAFAFYIISSHLNDILFYFTLSSLVMSSSLIYRLLFSACIFSPRLLLSLRFSSRFCVAPFFSYHLK